MLNGNKRSITLNTKSDEGRAIFTKLIEHCDVMVETCPAPLTGWGSRDWVPGDQSADDLRVR